MITKVKVNKINSVNSESKVVALATFLVSESFWVTKVKVINGKNGLFVSMPQHKKTSGEWEDTCFPATAELRSEITKTVIEEYNKL